MKEHQKGTGMSTAKVIGSAGPRFLLHELFTKCVRAI
jgi:hypothetical protein